MKGDSIVKEIQMKNFRSLKDTGMQKLSPITLLVGENSSGKSTFLRAFPLLKQSISKRTSGPILWAGDIDDYVDFGSFEETVTNDKSSDIVFSYKFPLNVTDQTRMYRFYDEFSDVKYGITNVNVCYEMTITSEDGKDRVSNLALDINNYHVDFDLDNKTIATAYGFYHKESDPAAEGKKETSRRGLFRRYWISSQTFNFVLPAFSEFYEEIYQNFPDSQEDEIDHFVLREFIPTIGLALTNSDDISLLDKKTIKQKKLTLAYAGIYNRIVSVIQKDETGRLKELAKLLAIYDIFPVIDEYISSYFNHVHYIAPLRATAERYYRLRNLAVDEVDYQGKNLPIFINSLTTPQLKAFHAWTDEHFGFTVNTDKDKGHLSLQIKLHGSDKAINLSDTGFGYSQVLPIITQLWELSSRNRTGAQRRVERNQRIPLVIAIEQPELHLHPAVQARLAKAFIACINLARKNKCDIQLLLETHSETIVNYFGRAIARGLLKPDDVSVILFEKGVDQSVTKVRNSGYDEDGYLVNWPYGFFESED